jgi:predicted nucleic acid-binding protein
MPPAGLIDTGAIVTIVNADESWHDACLEALASVQMPLLTTEAVLTELFHLIFARSLSLERAWRFVRSGALSIRSMGDSDLSHLSRVNDRICRPTDGLCRRDPGSPRSS